MAPPVGSRLRPYRRTPARFGAEGLPYGAFCECGRCEHVGRSTHAFDYYDDGEGGLVCEHCLYGVSYDAEVIMSRQIDAGTIRRDPLGPGCRGGYDERLG